MLVACENRRKRTCLIFPFFTFGTPQLEMPTHLVFQHLQPPPPPLLIIIAQSLKARYHDR